MARKLDRKKAKEGLRQRTKESYETKDQGMTFSRFFQRDANLPFWNPKRDAQHYIDIIPYMPGENDPGVVRGDYSIDDPVYHLDIWVHQRIGPRDLQVVCPEQNYNQRCPVCEFRNRLRKEDADDDDTKALLPKRRSVYNVIVRDEGSEEDKGIQILEVAHFFMEQKLMAAARRKKKDGDSYIPFSDPDEGKQIVFERNKKGKEFDEWEGHGFEDRDYDITDEDLDEAFCLDEFLILYSESELEDIVVEMEKGGITSGDGESDGEDEGGGGQRRSRRERAAKRGRDRDDGEEESSDRGSRRRGMKKMDKPASKKDDDGDPECPEGGTFGKDTDAFEGCDECPHYQDCLAAKEGDGEGGDDGDGGGEEESSDRGRRPRRRGRSRGSSDDGNGDGDSDGEGESSSRQGRRRGRRR